MDVDTRWNSTHNMLKTALIIKKSLSAIAEMLVESKESTKTIINNTEWDDVVKIVDLLEPFYQCDYFFLSLKDF